MTEIKYSVLMSVYYKEKPEYLRESINSMLNQTLIPDEIVLVKDGPLSEMLESVILEYNENPIIKIVELKENMGLGKALNIGLKNCRNDIIARMDSDDFSEKDRCEKQYNLIISEDVSVIGASVAEFVDNIDNIVAHKDTIMNHNEIVKRMKYRNPINHPTVMFKKTDVIAAGSYQHWYLNEDYYLWIRMVLMGYKFANIDEPLVRMRITNETYLRRAGWEYFITQKKLFDFMLKKKFINIADYSFNNVVRFVTRLLIPNKLRKVIYLNLLRRKS